MSNLKTQFGKASSADFEENVWTFKMSEGFKVSAGDFAIIPKEKFENILIALRGIINSMCVHPDCEEDSEFECMVSRCDEALSELI